MNTTLLKVAGMQGPECARLVINAIQDLPGIGHVELSLVTGEVSVEHGTMVSAGDIRQAILDAGFDAS
jgi:copper chaperone